jgi:3-hydroxyisobutyrate dehydrogenase
MGSQMATRLRNDGHELRVWNRTREKADAWARGKGGVACATPADSARTATELHLMLANDDAVDEVLFGPNGALTALAKNSLVADHCTVSVLLTNTRAQRIKEGGWRFLQAPLLAGPANVAKGEGLMLVGGAKATYDAALTVLRQIIEKHCYVGESERDAAAFKLMANAMLLSITQALAEFYSLGRANSIPPERALELFDHFDPGRTIYIRGPRMARGDFSATFQATMAAKDADLMLHAGRQGGADMPTIELVFQRLLRLIKSGHGNLDLGALAYDAIHAKGTTSAPASELSNVGGEG